MKLLIVCQVVDKNDPVLGFFHRWIEVFASSAESIHVICLKEGEHQLPENVTVHSLGKENEQGSRIAKRFRYSIRFMKLVRELRDEYDSVFVHMNPEYVLLAGLFWRTENIPVGLWYVHQHVPWKLWFAESLVDHIFTATPVSVLMKSSKIRVMGHGIDLAHYNTPHVPDGSKLRAITISRLSPSKDIESMIEATHAVRDIPVHLSIVGSAGTPEQEAYVDRMKERAHELGLDSLVTFVGPRPPEEVPKLLAQADMFLNMSATGGPDKAVLEAMSMRVPVITANTACISLLTEFPELCVPLFDREALVQSIRTVAAWGPEKRAEVGAQLRAIIERDHNLGRLIPGIIRILGTQPK